MTSTAASSILSSQRRQGPLRALLPCLAVVVLLGGCHSTPVPSATASRSSAATATPLACIEQLVWERHEGAFSGHWEAAQAAAASRDTDTGTSEAGLAAIDVRAMGELAARSNRGVRDLLREAADAMESAATAFRANDFTSVESLLSEAQNKHELALGSTTAEDWCS